MQNIKDMGDIYMALHINKTLYDRGNIPYDIYSNANRAFLERLHRLENQSIQRLTKPS